MIYLFEDRKGRMEQYLSEHLDSNIIKVAIIDCAKIDLMNFLSSNFSDSSAVIFHSSYSFNDKDITNEDVKKYFSDKKIPFVYFSGGLNNNLVLENGVTNGNVNSGDMYINLTSFLKEYKDTKSIIVALLVYGEKYLLNSLLELQAVCALYLFDKKHNYILNTEDFYELIDLVDARLKEEELKEDKHKLIELLNMNLEERKLEKQALLSNIQKLTEKY